MVLVSLCVVLLNAYFDHIYSIMSVKQPTMKSPQVRSKKEKKVLTLDEKIEVIDVLEIKVGWTETGRKCDLSYHPK